MKDLHEMLLNVNDSYADFVAGVERQCNEEPDKKAAVIKAIMENDNIGTDDILAICANIKNKKMGFALN